LSVVGFQLQAAGRDEKRKSKIASCASSFEFRFSTQATDHGQLAVLEELLMLKIGDQAPGFSLPADSGKKISLDAFQGKTLVLFFFPKADTPG
jgi:cytochrome oxidase Cu insertion factor (SCO1/SenC/PrrC family)